MTTEVAVEISRKELIEKTIEMLEDLSRHRDIEIPDALMAEMIDVLQTTERLSWAWWYAPGDCGCLIGTVRQRRGERPAPSTWDGRAEETERRIGIGFISVWRSLGLGPASDAMMCVNVVDR